MRFLFIDADILLDVALNHVQHHTPSAQILALTEGFEFVGCTTVHTLLSVHAVAEQHLDKTAADKAIELLIEKLQVIVEGKEVVEQALAAGFGNFDDAVKYFAAINAGCEAIISRNVSRHENAQLPVFTAEEFLKSIPEKGYV